MQCTHPIYVLVTYPCLLHMFICSCASTGDGDSIRSMQILPLHDGKTSRLCGSSLILCAETQTHQTKCCCNFLAASHAGIPFNQWLAQVTARGQRWYWERAWWDQGRGRAMRKITLICSIWLKPWSEGRRGGMFADAYSLNPRPC